MGAIGISLQTLGCRHETRPKEPRYQSGENSTPLNAFSKRISSFLALCPACLLSFPVTKSRRFLGESTSWNAPRYAKQVAQ